jgi:hypothetical protein
MPDVQNDDRQPRMAEIDATELIPPDWHDQPVWISSYRVFRLPASALLKTEPFDLLGVRAQLFWGRAPIWNSTLTLRPQPDGGVVAESVVEGVAHAPGGPYLLLMTPTESDATPTAVELTRSRLRSVVALLRLTLGRNIAVEPLGDLTFTASARNVTVQESFRSPTVDPAPDLSAPRLQMLSDIDQAIDRLDERQRGRAALSLQWFFDAQDNVGVDSFLSYWFALDSLAMPQPSGVKAFEGRLATMYGLERTDVASQFRLGRLKNFRDRIVHEALRPPIHIRLLDFLSALYWDALLDILGLAAQRVAGQVLAAHHIEEWFPGLGPPASRQTAAP